MAIIRLNNNRPNTQATSTLPAERRANRWLLPAGYVAIFLLILLALVSIARAHNSSSAGQYAMFVASSSSGMVSLVSAPGQAEVSQAVNTATANNPVAAIAQSLSDDQDRPFGPPIDPTRTDWVISKDYAAHGGPGPYGAIDIAFFHDQNALGSPLHATHTGIVKTLHDNAIYGNLVYVIGKDYTTTYGHMQKITVTDGQMVKRGDVLGEMGSTGNSTGPHVDYETWSCIGDPQASGTAGRTCVNKNPMDYLK